MSVKAIKWAFAQKVGSPTGKAVLVALADNANDEGYCWPSFTSIAQKTELTRTAVRNWIAKLEGLGFLDKEHRHTEEGDHTSNAYRLRFGRRAVVGNQVAHVGNDVAHLGNKVTHSGQSGCPREAMRLPTVGNEVAHPPALKTAESSASRGLQPDPPIPNHQLTVIESPPQPQAPPAANGGPVVVRGGGDFEKTEEVKAEPPALIFPNALKPREREEAGKLLSQIGHASAQEILDVLAAVMKAGEVRKGNLAVLAGLVKRFHAGSFDLTPGLGIAEGRRLQREAEARAKASVQQAQAIAAAALPEPPEPDGLSAKERALRGMKLRRKRYEPTETHRAEL